MSKHNTTVLRQIRAALRNGDALSDAQVAKLAEIRRAENVGKRHVRVHKLALREGEELMDFVWTVCDAVQTNRIVLADGSLDAWLVGIFDEHVVVEDGNTGRLFRAEFARDDKGEFSFSEPVEVRMEFVPVERTEDDEAEAAVEKSAGSERVVEVAKAAAGRGKWGGILPASLRRR